MHGSLRCCTQGSGRSLNVLHEPQPALAVLKALVVKQTCGRQRVSVPRETFLSKVRRSALAVHSIGIEKGCNPLPWEEYSSPFDSCCCSGGSGRSVCCVRLVLSWAQTGYADTAVCQDQ